MATESSRKGQSLHPSTLTPVTVTVLVGTFGVIEAASQLGRG